MPSVEKKFDNMSMNESKELNVLVMGETGVGKSTWINAIANYITFTDLEEASTRELIVLIPSKFTYRDNQDRQHSIETGADNNECFEEGKSATLTPRAYEFPHNGILYRIIDTPGIGDVDGIEADKRNMANIIEFVARYECLHAIVILLPPNKARLTDHFQFCFKELLVQFHRSAANNIVFGYTNTAGHGFRAQETASQLDLLLKDIRENQQINITRNGRSFFFDNMAYRFMCINQVKGDIEFEDYELESYILSFKHSKSNTLKMLDYIGKLEPHNAKESVQLCKVRNIVFCLTVPLAAISNAVQATITEINDFISELNEHRNDEAKLREKLMEPIRITRWKMEVATHDYCRTCASKREYFGEERQKLIEADPSLAKDNPIVMFTPDKLLKPGENCPKCGVHMVRITGTKWFDTYVEIIHEKNMRIDSQIHNSEGLQRGLNAKLEQKQTLRKEMEEEQKMIFMAAVKCAFFLKKYSITAWNDSTESYLDTMIDCEKNHNRNSSRLKAYKDMRARYVEQKRVFENFVNKADASRDNLDPNQMLAMIEDLKKLKWYGKDIADAILKSSKSTDFDKNGKQLVHRFQPDNHKKNIVKRTWDYFTGG